MILIKKGIIIKTNKMNWIEINKKYPNAYKILNDREYNHLTIGFNIRDLYDFFDEQGIYIEINPHMFVNPETWTFHIHLGDILILNDDKYYNRKEAEEAAFEKAFETLEEKTKNDKK